jgi:transposase-like protein
MRRACLEYGYTMAAVAREAGIHYSTVSKVIKGELLNDKKNKTSGRDVLANPR